MWWIAVLIALLGVAVINVLTATVIGGYLSDSFLFVLFYLKQTVYLLLALLYKLWLLIVKFLTTLRWYDVVIIPLILRLRRVVFFDLPYRFVTNYLAPMLLLDVANRALIRKRITMLTTYLRLHWRIWFDRSVERLEPWFGRHARTALWMMLSGILILGLFALTGAWFVVAWIPAVERWLQQFSVWLIRLGRRLSGTIAHTVFRTSVLLMFTIWWKRLGQKLVPQSTRQYIRLRQRSLARKVIRRRRTLTSRLRGLTWWQKLTIRNLGFWEVMFDHHLRTKMQVARNRQLEISLAKYPDLRHLKVRVQCSFCPTDSQPPSI